jgi:hypothetical protein
MLIGRDENIQKSTSLYAHHSIIIALSDAICEKTAAMSIPNTLRFVMKILLDNTDQL